MNLLYPHRFCSRPAPSLETGIVMLLAAGLAACSSSGPQGVPVESRPAAAQTAAKTENLGAGRLADRADHPAPVTLREQDGRERLATTARPEPAPLAKQKAAKDDAPRAASLAAIPSAPPPYPAPVPQQPVEASTEQYAHLPDHAVQRVAEAPVSTFSIDVDTGSYSNVRRMLRSGRLPPGDAVRVEEMINYFPYVHALPRRLPNQPLAPFGVSTEIAPSPWNPNNHLLRIGIKASDVDSEQLPPANLVFLVDVSGSMNAPERLPLVKVALRKLTEHLRPQDHVSLVTYASGTRVVLEPTADKSRIRQALDHLVPGGSTAGAAGIELAYQMAQQGFIPGGINRILLATDGDFNVGLTNFNQFKERVAEKRKSGIALSTLGFGTHNYNERLMEQLADVGDGQYSYIDNEIEAHKVMVDEISATLATVAKDVKIQLEFNPAQVSEYRLIGYENRALKREDFSNDKVDAGDIGSGHTVTALYEVTLAGRPGQIEPLRYGKAAGGSRDGKPGGVARSEELAWLRLRYKLPDQDRSRLLEVPLHQHEIKPLHAVSEDWRFAAAVAAFGQQLKGGRYLGRFDWPDIRQLAAGAQGKDSFGYRAEFIGLVDQAAALSTPRLGQAQVPDRVWIAQ